MIYELTNPETAAPLFGQWKETLIWSCLQGIMGKIYASALDKPASALALIGDFCFLAGEINRELIACCQDGHNPDFLIIVPQNENWKAAILDYYGNRAKLISRYATCKEPDAFHRAALEKAAASLPDGCQIRQIDERLYHMCKSEKWSADLVSLFPDYESYQRLGLGCVVTEGNRILSGASSYSRYREGIEIEIDTRENYRRRGLAYACAARLILECLARNLYPSWDAHNRASLSLAEKLGYRYSHTYEAIEITGK